MASAPNVGAGNVLQLMFVLALGSVCYAITMFATARDTVREAVALATPLLSKWRTL
jgi:hypothetical protein